MAEKQCTIKEPFAFLRDRIMTIIIDYFVMSLAANASGIIILIAWCKKKKIKHYFKLRDVFIKFFNIIFNIID